MHASFFLFARIVPVADDRYAPYAHIHDVRLVLARLDGRSEYPLGLVFSRAKTPEEYGKEGTLRLSAAFAAVYSGRKPPKYRGALMRRVYIPVPPELVIAAGG